MSLWSFGAAPSEFSAMTFRDAKAWVARIVGAQDTPDVVGSGDAIAAAIDELNRRRWEFLTVRGSDIPVVAGTSDYDLPTPFKDPLSLILTGSSDGSDRTLTYVPRGTWDPLTENHRVGGTYFYTNFATGTTHKIQLMDTPDGPGTLQLRYYRPIQTPLQEEDTLDVIKGPIQLALLARAQVWVATWRGLHSERLAMIESRADQLLKKAYGDEVPIDWTPQLVPGRIWMRRPLNADSVPHWWE